MKRTILNITLGLLLSLGAGAQDPQVLSTLEYDFEASLTLAQDTKPAEGSPLLDLQIDLAQLVETGPGLSNGPLMRAQVGAQGTWTPVQLDEDIGALLPAEQWESVWGLKEVDYDLRLGWCWTAGKSAGWNTLDLVTIVRGALNDVDKDIQPHPNMTLSEQFTHQSVGVGIQWTQKVGEGLVFGYSPKLDVLYSPNLDATSGGVVVDIGKTWMRGGLTAELETKGSDLEWGLSASQTFNTLWHPELNTELDLRAKYTMGRWEMRMSLLEFDWSQKVPDWDFSKAVGQQSRWSSGVGFRWKTKDWAVGVQMEQPWWSLNRNRVNDPRDKAFELTLYWAMEGKDRDRAK